MLLVPINKDGDQDSRVYLMFKPSSIPFVELFRGAWPDSEMALPSSIPLPGALSPLERLKWFARMGADRSPHDPMPTGYYRLLIVLGDDIGDRMWFCDRDFYERAPGNLKRPLEEIETLPLCNLLEALLYLVRWERHDGFWGAVLGSAWHTGQIQALARGVRSRLEEGEWPVPSRRGW